MAARRNGSSYDVAILDAPSTSLLALTDASFVNAKVTLPKLVQKKKAQYLKLIDFLAQNTKFNPDDDKVESLFSLMDKITPDTIATVVDESSDYEIYELYQAQPTITPSHQIPLAPVTILTST